MKKNAYCFDFDGTLTIQESIPLLSRSMGLEEEVALITDLTMKGLIPFDSSFKLRIALLAKLSQTEVHEIIEKIKINTKIYDFIQENKEDCFIVSSNLDFFIKLYVDEHIGCKLYSSEAEIVDGDLKGINKIIKKEDAIKELQKEYENVIAVGDGANDISMLKTADVGIALQNHRELSQDLVQASDYVASGEQELINILKTFSNN